MLLVNRITDTTLSTTDRFGPLGPQNFPPKLVDDVFGDMRLVASPLSGHFNSPDPDHKLILDRSHVELDLDQTGAFLFDNDGLLINSEKVILYAILAGAEELVRNDTHSNFTFTREQAETIKRNCFGKSEQDMAASLLTVLRALGLTGSELNTIEDSVFQEKLNQARQQIVVQAMKSGEVQAMPGAIDFLKALLDAGVKAALVTGNTRFFIEHQFTYVLEPLFPEVRKLFPREHWVLAGDFPKGLGKPNALPYQIAMKKLGMSNCPERCVAFEDRANGAVAALLAGARVIIVPEDLSYKPFTCPSKDHSLQSMRPIFDTFLGPDAHSRYAFAAGMHAISLTRNGVMLYTPAYRRAPVAELK